MNAFDLLDVVLMGKSPFLIDAVVVGPLVFDKSLENKMVCVVNYWLLLKTIYKVDHFFCLVYLLCEFSCFCSSNSNNTSFQSFLFVFLYCAGSPSVSNFRGVMTCEITFAIQSFCVLKGISVFVFH